MYKLYFLIFIAWSTFESFKLILLLFLNKNKSYLKKIEPVVLPMEIPKFKYSFEGSTNLKNVFISDNPYQYQFNSIYYFVNFFTISMHYNKVELYLRTFLLIYSAIIYYFYFYFSVEISKLIIAGFVLFILFYWIKYMFLNHNKPKKLKKTTAKIIHAKLIDNELEKYIINIEILSINHMTNCYYLDSPIIGQSIEIQYDPNFPDYVNIY